MKEEQEDDTPKKTTFYERTPRTPRTGGKDLPDPEDEDSLHYLLTNKSITSVERITRKETDPPLLTEIDAIKWQSFKNCFIRVAVLNRWEPEMAKLRMLTCIRDKAARAIEHLRLDRQDDITFDEVISVIEDVYLNPSGIEFNKAVFKTSSRESGESLLAWHTRARELYLRAYPDADCEKNSDLKDKFTLAILDKQLSIRIKSSDWYDDWSYSEILNRAQKIQGSALIVHQAYTGKTLAADTVGAIDKLDGKSVAAFGGPSKEITCYHCEQKGHVVNECPLYQKAIERVRKNPGKFHLQPVSKTTEPTTTNSSGSKEWKKPWNKNRRPNKNRKPNNSKSTNAIQEEDDDEEVDVATGN